MKGAYDRHKEAGLTVIGIGIRDTEVNIRKFTEDNGVQWPVGYDTDDRISKLYGITLGAETVFIDRTGTVKGRFLGGFNEEKLETELRKIL